MNILDNIDLGIKAIVGNKLRTTLTILIIAFGIMALVGILTAVDAIKASLSSNFASMGANNFDIRKKGTGVQFGFNFRKKTYKAITYEQALDFKKRFFYPSTISISTLALRGAKATWQNQSTNPTVPVFAADENYLQVGGFNLMYGRFFTEQEVLSGKNLVIIGKDIAVKLFGTAARAQNQLIGINNQKYTILGILESKGSSSIFNSDNMAIIPLGKAQNQYATPQTTYVVTVNVPSGYESNVALSEATGLMRAIRKNKLQEEADFDVSKSDKLASTLIENTSTITTAATIIGIITLLGGAIGLMNIMLVSVAERTREIGITKAIGASNTTILRQFLTESVIICQMGGIVGILLGISVGNAVSVLLKGPFIVPWQWIEFGIVVCFIVGVLSGLYPAIKAANTDPIESLRHE